MYYAISVTSNEMDLLRLAREGDQSAAEELFTKYLQESRSIQGLLRRALSKKEDQEDMLQEIYLQLVSGRNLFRGEARLSTYVYQVARITLLQKFRRENTLKRGKVYRTISQTFDVADQNQASPEYVYSMKETREILLEILEKLPLAYRDVLKLRVLQDLSYEEIARQTGLPINTVSTKIHKGKKFLAMILKDKGLTEVFDL
jgi:RNA polymerase sigma-70 factor (ECF subfamily)